MSDSILEVRDLTVTLRHRGASGRRLLDAIDFSVAAGEFVGLSGPSGSGKSTLALALLGLIDNGKQASVSGSVELHGGQLLGQPAAQRDGRSIAGIFQDPVAALNPVRTVGSQLREVAQRHLPRGSRQSQVQSALSSLQLPDALLQRYPFQLSGGQCQRIAICMAMVISPAVLIADEPTSALDTLSQQAVMQALDVLRQQGSAIVLISHDRRLIGRWCDRSMVMDAGRLTVNQAVSEGDLPGPKYRKPAASDGNSPVLRCHGVVARHRANGSSKGNRGSAALAGITFELSAGETLAVVGPSGCGKSTLARVLVGLHPASGGRIQWGGALERPSRRQRARMAQLVFQNPALSLSPTKTVMKLIAEPMLLHTTVSRSQVKDKVAKWLARVGLSTELVDRYPHQLSGGQQQRIAIARAICLEPRVLIADEPVAALDDDMRQAALQLLAQVQVQHRMALILISHDLSSVTKVSDRLLVMDAGRVVELGETARVLAAPSHPLTQALLAADCG